MNPLLGSIQCMEDPRSIIDSASRVETNIDTRALGWEVNGKKKLGIAIVLYFTTRRRNTTCEELGIGVSRPERGGVNKVPFELTFKLGVGIVSSYCGHGCSLGLSDLSPPFL